MVGEGRSKKDLVDKGLVAMFLRMSPEGLANHVIRLTTISLPLYGYEECLSLRTLCTKLFYYMWSSAISPS